LIAPLVKNEGIFDLSFPQFQSPSGNSEVGIDLMIGPAEISSPGLKNFPNPGNIRTAGLDFNDATLHIFRSNLSSRNENNKNRFFPGAISHAKFPVILPRQNPAQTAEKGKTKKLARFF
jgi:hypothetical protein